MRTNSNMKSRREVLQVMIEIVQTLAPGISRFLKFTRIRAASPPLIFEHQFFKISEVIGGLKFETEVDKLI